MSIRLAFSNPLFVINVPAAVACLMEMACKAERGKVGGEFWYRMAEDLEAGKYLSRPAAEDLMVRFPFLSQFRN